MEVLIATTTSYLAIVPNWADTYLSQEEIASYWQLPLLHRPPITIYGKTVHQHRDVGFFSDFSEGYRYSGQLMASQPLVPAVTHVMDLVNQYLGTGFNGVLANLYHTGEDYISAHSDNTTALDPRTSSVVSIAFGSTRNFRIRATASCPSSELVVSSTSFSSRGAEHRKVDARKTGSTSTIIADIPHYAGTLLIMAGQFQEQFTHEIPTSAAVLEPRLSLTFRHHTI